MLEGHAALGVWLPATFVTLSRIWKTFSYSMAG